MENSQLGDLMLGTKLGVVKRNETKDLQLDRKCVESGPGNIQLEEMASSMVVLKSTLCYCRTDGCNQGCPHHPPTMVLPLILTWLLVILSATQTSAFFTL
ncbi:unnamed protein product [Allacma fusca]|uniref:Uncharacterized protein n=1 Tax=Allacma fusca TaxID=39272 RepID=A0A8J2PLU4_9HEXA|nr:unnamed protein product [Allacma fusca]